MKHAKHWLALRLPGLKVHSAVRCSHRAEDNHCSEVESIIVAKEKPSEKTHGQGLRNFPANWILEDEAERACGFLAV